MRIKLVGVDDVPVQIVRKQYSLVMDEETCAVIMAALDYATDHMEDEELHDAVIPEVFNHIKLDEDKLANTYKELNDLFKEKRK